MINYLNKFNLKNKIAYIVGGLGLIGQEISIALASAGAETILLDVNKKIAKNFQTKIKKQGYNLKYKYFKFIKHFLHLLHIHPHQNIYYSFLSLKHLVQNLYINLLLL